MTNTGSREQMTVKVSTTLSPSGRG